VKKTLIGMVLMFLSVFVIASGANARPLPPTSDWAISYYEQAIGYNILPKGLYKLDGTENLIREDTAEFLVKIYDSLTDEKVKATRPSPFDDTNDKYVLRAKRLGLVAGTMEGTFLPKEEITREDLCKVSYQLIKMFDPDCSFDLSTLSEGDLFLDHNKIYDGGSNIDAYREAIYGLRDLGLIKGYEDRCFRPQGTVTCEEAVVFYVGLYEYLQDIIN